MFQWKEKEKNFSVMHKCINIKIVEYFTFIKFNLIIDDVVLLYDGKTII